MYIDHMHSKIDILEVLYFHPQQPLPMSMIGE